MIYVDDDGPADFATIQAAIDDAKDGDTVIVADGVYSGAGNYNISLRRKAITLKSQNGPDNCIIDAVDYDRTPCRVFLLQGGEAPDTVIDGFMITSK